MSRWDALLAVQDHDTRLDRLRHQIEGLPERAVLAAAEKELVDLEAQAAAVQAERHEIERDQKRLEDEVGGLSERVAHTDKVLYGGTVSNPRELQALQDEIASLRRRISDLEDREIELMEAAEPLDARLEALARERDAIDARAASARAALAEAEVTLGAERDAASAERDELAAAIDPELRAEYESLRSRFGGIGIARLVGAQCGGCHLTLSAVEVDRIKHLGPDEPAHCEECGRLLAR
ncbi:MAG: zinc ribbon domain-containing protein [Acidimicrobiia bacterium]